MYTDVPPLLPILEQLEPYSKSSGNPPGKFALYDGTDYLDLGFYIAILSIAVSNLKGYVAQERQRFKPRAVPDSPGKVGDKPKTELQLLHAALEALHSNICMLVFVLLRPALSDETFSGFPSCPPGKVENQSCS